MAKKVVYGTGFRKRVLVEPAQRPPCASAADGRAWVESLAPCPFCRHICGFGVPLVETERFGLAHESCFVDKAPKSADEIYVERQSEGLFR